MRTHHWLSITLVGLLLAMMLTSVSAADGTASGPPRYQTAIGSEQSLLSVLAAGLVADTLGYDANEIVGAVKETDMPVEDIVPTWMVAYLSGRTYINVLERRTEGDRWGEILNRFKVDEGDLEELSIPSDVEVTDLRSIPDQVVEDLLMCAAVSEVFDLDADEVYEFYQDGWSATDVLAAAELAYRSRQTMSELLSGKAIRVDWYREARSMEIDLRELARENGRCFDNDSPVISQEPRRGDLEVTYSSDVAVRTYGIPLSTVQELRFRYLLTPAEVLQVLYVSRTCGRDYWDVARIYSWDHWHRWAPTLVVLRLPITHFRGLPVWDELPLDYYAIDPWRLDSILLGCSLSLGGAFDFSFYWSTFDPWYRPWDPIMYCGLHWRHGWGWSDYYNWRREPHPWRGHAEIGRDWGDWNRSRDWDGHRVVGVVIGDHRPGEARQSWDRAPRTWDRAYGRDGRPEIVNRDGRVEYGQYPGMTLHKGGRDDARGRPQGPDRGGIEFGERVGRGPQTGPGGPGAGDRGNGPGEGRPTIGTGRPGGPRVEYGEPRNSGPSTRPDREPRSGSGQPPVSRPGGSQGSGPGQDRPDISGRHSEGSGGSGGSGGGSEHTPRVAPQPQNPPSPGPGAGPGQQNHQQQRHQDHQGGGGGGSVQPGPGSGGGGSPQPQPRHDSNGGSQPQPRHDDSNGGGGNGGGGPHVGGGGNGGGGNGRGGSHGGGGGPQGGGGGGSRGGGGGGGRHGDVSG